MNAFFYTMQQGHCDSDCRWVICPHRYLSMLRSIDGLQNIQAICGGVKTGRLPLDSFPKSGDLILLYVKSSDDLDRMLTRRELFDGLRKILVVADSAATDDRKYHLLAPRYINRAGESLAELEAVIRKMTGYVQ
jgi:hypothetical protein